MSRKLALLLLVVSAIAASFALVACGDDDDDDGETTAAEETASAEEVTVTADEYSFELSATPTAETTTVTFENVGSERHELLFALINEGFTVEEAIELEGEEGSAEVVGFVPPNRGKPGATEEVRIEEPLQAGNYAMLCMLRTEEGEPHYELGQLEEFTVE
ncbi:MAG: hypothetical protein ACRDKX_04825 [Solirubrobacterales bacterium]